MVSAVRIGRDRVVDSGKQVIDRLLRDRQHWSVRTLFADDLREVTQRAVEGHGLGGFDRRLVSDADAAFVADPFVVRHGDRWFMFVEVFDRGVNRGVIGAASSGDGLHWTWEGVVLRESTHLSYPQVIATDGRTVMVPETGERDGVRLYEATSFPNGWIDRGELFPLEGAADASLVEHNGRWWCFAASALNDGDLRLFSAPSLQVGVDWNEHPQSPIVSSDPTTSRPAGRPVMIDGRLHRLSQNLRPRYGVSVRAHRIDQLDEDVYREDQRGSVLLHPTGVGWNRMGTHHLSSASQSGATQQLVAIDGY